MSKILKEITPLTANDLFISRYYPSNRFDYPLHSHCDFEINLTINHSGRYQRVVGNAVEEMHGSDLSLIFPDTLHQYIKEDYEDGLDTPAEVIVIQFSKSLPEWRFLHTSQMSSIFKMLSQNIPGLEFSENVVKKVKDKMLRLCSLQGFKGAEVFLEILNDLATCSKENVRTIGSCLDGKEVESHYVERINKIIAFVQSHYHEKISLEQIGDLVGMSPSSASRYFKQKSGNNFWNYLNAFRTDCAAKMLIETDFNISEICYKCGFNNLSNFNKVFRERLQKTPSEFRSSMRAASKNK